MTSEDKTKKQLVNEVNFLQKLVKNLEKLKPLLKNKTKKLRQANETFEERVECRTATERIINRQLHAEIEQRKQAEQAAQDAREYAESIVDTVREPLLVLDADLRVISASRSFYQTFKVKLVKTEKHHIYDLGNHQWDIPQLRHLLENIIPKSTSFDEFEVEHTFPNIGKRIMLLNARKIYREANNTQLLLLAIEDITERKHLEKELRKTQEELRVLSITDTLTGLYNRRGFLTLAQQQIKMAKRNKQDIGLLFADLDNMKHINDSLGHQDGDSALVEAANILKASFRESDVIARIGGDEFAVLVIQPHKDFAQILTARLKENLDKCNAEANRRYALSLSTGIVYCDADHQRSIYELLSEADKLMYDQKLTRKEHSSETKRDW
ncbi:MAG: sensor domain-containing diguanylate cyclase [Candidatus Omnitrophica bacterium]|nr:sensor domain-containing diguanylate cyclase [Candidatus Omnitrophota bacterium]